MLSARHGPTHHPACRRTSFRRILGTRTPGINTGAISTNMTLGAYDALFLLRGSLDSDSPATTEDLRIRP